MDLRFAVLLCVCASCVAALFSAFAAWKEKQAPRKPMRRVKQRPGRAFAFEHLEDRRMLSAGGWTSASDISINGFHSTTDGKVAVVYTLSDDLPTGAAFDVGLYTSHNGTSADTALQKVTISDASLLTAGQHTVTITPNFQDVQQDYQLVAKVDASEQIAESNETNNVLAFAGGTFLNGTELQVQGTSAADTLTAFKVYDANENVTGINVNFDGEQHTYAPSEVTSVHVRTQGGNDSIASDLPSWQFGGDGDDTLANDGYGGAYLDGGAGNNNVSGVGASDQLLADDGNNTLWELGNNAKFTLGNGNNTLTVLGSNATITAGTGTNDITTTGGTNNVTAGGGQDTLHLAGANNLTFVPAPQLPFVNDLKFIYFGTSGDDTAQVTAQDGSVWHISGLPGSTSAQFTFAPDANGDVWATKSLGGNASIDDFENLNGPMRLVVNGGTLQVAAQDGSVWSLTNNSNDPAYVQFAATTDPNTGNVTQLTMTKSGAGQLNIGSIQNPSSPVDYQIAAGSLAISGPNGETLTLSNTGSDPNVQVALSTDANGHTVLTKTGTGTLNIDGVQNLASTLNLVISGGSVTSFVPPNTLHVTAQDGSEWNAANHTGTTGANYLTFALSTDANNSTYLAVTKSGIGSLDLDQGGSVCLPVQMAYTAGWINVNSHVAGPQITSFLAQEKANDVWELTGQVIAAQLANLPITFGGLLASFNITGVFTDAQGHFDVTRVLHNLTAGMVTAQTQDSTGILSNLTMQMISPTHRNVAIDDVTGNGQQLVVDYHIDSTATTDLTALDIGIYASNNGGATSTLLMTQSITAANLLSAGTAHSIALDADFDLAPGNLGPNYQLIAKVNYDQQVAEYDTSDDSATLASGLYVSQIGGLGILQIHGDALSGPVTLTDNGNGTFGVGLNGQQYTYTASQLAGIQMHTQSAPVQVGIVSGTFAITAPDGSQWTLSGGGGGTAYVAFQNDPNDGLVATKTGPGTLLVGNVSSVGPIAFVNAAGTTQFNADTGSATAANFLLEIQGGTTVAFNSLQHLSYLAVDAGGTMLVNESAVPVDGTAAIQVNGEVSLDGTSSTLKYVATDTATRGVTPILLYAAHGVSGYFTTIDGSGANLSSSSLHWHIQYLGDMWAAGDEQVALQAVNGNTGLSRFYTRPDGTLVIGYDVKTTFTSAFNVKLTTMSVDSGTSTTWVTSIGTLDSTAGYHEYVVPAAARAALGTDVQFFATISTSNLADAAFDSNIQFGSGMFINGHILETLGSAVAGNTLTVTEDSNGNVNATFNGKFLSIPAAASITRVDFLGFGGDDVVSSDLLCNLFGGDGNDTLTSTAAGSFLQGGDGDDTFTISGGTALSPTFIAAGQGDNTYDLSGNSVVYLSGVSNVQDFHLDSAGGVANVIAQDGSQWTLSSAANQESSWQFSADAGGHATLGVTSGVVSIDSAAPAVVNGVLHLNVSAASLSMQVQSGVSFEITAQDGSVWSVSNPAADDSILTFAMTAGHLTVTKSGTGTLNVDQVSGLTTAADFINQAGGTQFNSDTAASGTPHLSVTVANGQVAFNSVQHLAALTIDDAAQAALLATDGGTHALVVSHLSLQGSGTLDLANNRLVVSGLSYADEITSLTAIEGWISAALNLDGTNAWTGAGITSSYAARNPALTGIGAILNLVNPNDSASNALYSGTAWSSNTLLAGGEVLVRYTLLGDTDLNGAIAQNDIDRQALGDTSGQSPAHGPNGQPGWYYGDTNYDGLVNGLDQSNLAAASNWTNPDSTNYGLPAHTSVSSYLAPDGSRWALTNNSDQDVALQFTTTYDDFGTPLALTVVKSGAGTLTLGDVGDLTVPIALEVQSGNAVFNGVQFLNELTIDTGATATLAGAATGSSNAASVINNGALVVTGTNQFVGDITGSGTLTVAAGASLQAGNIVGQTAIIVEGTAVVGNIDGVPQGSIPSGSNVGTITVGVASGDGHLTANRIIADSLTIGKVGSTTISTVTINASGPSLYVAPGNSIVPTGSYTGTTILNSLSIANAAGNYFGKFDLKNNNLVINYSGSSPVFDIRDAISAAYDNGAWDGNGLTSSMISLNLQLFALGYGQNSDLGAAAFSSTNLFEGVAVNPNSVLVKFTWTDDLNLDGVVNFDDLQQFKNDYLIGTTGNTFVTGDVNYDGVITFDDNQVFKNVYILSQVQL